MADDSGMVLGEGSEDSMQHMSDDMSNDFVLPMLSKT